MPRRAHQSTLLELGERIHRSKHADTHRGLYKSREVVIKQRRPDITDAKAFEQARLNIIREGYLLQRFDHPGIVHCQHIDDAAGMIMLDQVPGENLREIMRTRRILSAREVARVGAQLAESLAEIHKRWLVHRDVKPANIMYGHQRAVLIDFHLATEPGQMNGGAGTRLFVAPEQARGGIVAGTADIWGLGVVLYRAATSHLPFHAPEGFPQLTERPLPALQRLADSKFGGNTERAQRQLPIELAEVIDSMLQHNANDRPQAWSLHEQLTEIASWVGGDASEFVPQ